MRRHNLINVIGIHIGVPNRLRVDHCHWACRAAVQTTGLVDADFASARQARRLDLGLAAVKRLLGAVVGAALIAGLALIQTEKDMPLVIVFGKFGDFWGGIGQGQDLILLIASVSRILAPRQPGQQVEQSGIWPQPAQPLRQAMKAYKPPLLPSL